MTKEEFVKWWHTRAWQPSDRGLKGEASVGAYDAWRQYMSTYGENERWFINHIPEDRIDEFVATYTLLFG